MIKNKLAVKAYYKLLYLLLPKRPCELPNNMAALRNLILYFDYEREFSGHETKIGDKDIFNLIELLDKFHLKTTWFTVGKIFNKYPDTVDLLMKNKHEIASHTYHHLPPLHTSFRRLKKDFILVKSNTPVEIFGFHAPKGRWSLVSMYLLNRFKYKYDVVTDPRSKVFLPFKQMLPFKNDILRFPTVGDDWPIYKRDASVQDVFDHFSRLFDKIKKGEMAGIGFHPWVLFSNENILKGFELFMEYIKNQPDVNIDTALNFANKINRKHL